MVLLAFGPAKMSGSRKPEKGSTRPDRPTVMPLLAPGVTIESVGFGGWWSASVP